MPNEKYKIVLIEDQKSHADYICSVLDSAKFEIKVLVDGKSASEYLENPENIPDLVLVDNILPDMEGIEIIDFFVKKKLDYGFVILTGSNSVNLAVKAMKIGALDYISKSLNLQEELELVVLKTINLHKERLAKQKLEKQLKEKEAQLKEVNATKEKLFSIIAHDLKSPFTSIIGFSDLLIKNVGKCDQSKLMNYITSIHAVAENTYTLLENLLNWVNTQKGKVRCEPKRIGVKEISDQIIKVLISSAKLKNIELRSRVKDDAEVYADQQMLKTILLNLITNAIKFTESGGKVTLEAKHANNYAEIKVTDTGIGMDDKTIKSLFKLNKAKPKSGTNGEKGSGLGLMVCKDFVEMHKGKISVASEINKGTTFIFALPFKK